MKLTPLADNVLLKHMEAEEKTASGIILSTANKEKSVSRKSSRQARAPTTSRLRSNPATRL